MIDLFAGIRSLDLPYDAPLGAPKIRLNPDIPAELKTFYTGVSDPIVAAILFYTDADSYTYLGALTNTGMAVGHVENGTVSEVFLIGSGGGLTGFRIAARTAPVWVQIGASTGTSDRLQMLPSSTFMIDEGAGFEIDSRSAPRGYIGSQALEAAAGNTTSTGSETAVPSADWATEPSYTFADGRVYKITGNISMYSSLTGATSEQARFRVRQGAASTTGQILADWRHHFEANNTANQVNGPKVFESYCYNNTGADVTTDLSLTIARLAGTGTVGLYSDNDLRTNLVVEDVMSVADCTMISDIFAVA